MRFKSKKRIEQGAIRIVKRFSLFPISIWDGNEKRHITSWLEVVYIKQKYHDGYESSDWINENFVTKKEYNKYLLK